MACKHKDIFGKPREGAHKVRIPILDIALVDVAATLAVAALISWISDWPVLIVFLVLIVISIAVHRLFCVRTKMDKLIFPKAD